MVDNPSSHPLGPPSISGSTITVDLMLKQPTRITTVVADLSLQRFIADRIFTSAGGVTGGAVVYDEATENDLYSDRDVEEVAPGGEFPVVSSSRKVPKVAKVRKVGGKFFFTDEARDRNDGSAFADESRRLTNTIVKKNNSDAVALLEASIATSGQTIVGNDWSDFTLDGSDPTPNMDRPAADWLAANLSAEQRELGITYDTLLVNPQEAMNLAVNYGDKYDAAKTAAGIKEVFSSNRVVAGTAYYVAAKQVGEMRVEQPLSTETWRDPFGRQQTWVQTSVRPLMFVNNPYAVVKLTGLNG